MDVARCRRLTFGESSDVDGAQCVPGHYHLSGFSSNLVFVCEFTGL